MSDTTAAHQTSAKQNPSGQEALFQNMPLPAWVYDLETYQFLDVNAAAVEAYGYSREEFLSMYITDLCPQEDAPRLRESLQREHAGFQHSGEWRHRCKDGSVIDVEIYARAIPYSGRRAALMTALNITERRQSEETLREREEHYRAIFNGVQDAILVETLDGRILAVNDRACEMYGYTREEFLTKTVADLVPPNEPVLLMEGRETSPMLETYNLRANGERFPVEVSGRVQTLGGREILFIIVRDVTERKKAEEAIRWQNAYLAALQKTTLELLSELDLDALLKNIVERAGALVDTDAGLLALLEPHLGKMLPFVAQGALEIAIRDEIDPGVGFTGKIWQSGLPLLVQDYDHWEHRLPTFPKGVISALAGVPLFARGEVIGVLVVGHAFASPKKFTSQDIEILSQFAHLASLAIQNAGLFSAARRELEERRQTEKALAESEQRYRTLVEQLPVIVYVDDAQGELPVTRFVSPRIQEILGYSPEEWMAGDFDIWVRSIHPEDRERIINQYLTCIKEGSLFSETYRMFRRDGRLIWVRDTASVQKDEHGKPIRLQGVIQDITEIKEVEAAMRLQSAALEAADNAIVITDRNGTILWINSAYTRLSGYTLQEAKGKTPRILYSGVQDETFYKRLWDTILSGQVWRGELVNKRKDGSLYHEEQTITPILDANGQVTHFIGVKQDITPRKQTQAKLDQHIERLAALREIDQAIVSNFDMRVSLNFLLSRAVKLLAADAADILLLNPSAGLLQYEAGTGFRTPLPKNTSVKLEESYAGRAVQERRFLQIPDLTYDPNHLFRRGFLKNENFVSYYGMPLIVKGKVLGIMEVFDRSIKHRDDAWFELLNALAGQAAIAIENAKLFNDLQKELLERRLIEEELRKSHLNLEKRIEERTADIQRVNFELQRALRVKDEFLANMSHELRTPLNAIIGLSDSLAEQIVGSLNEKQQKYLATIRESGQHLLELINDILDLAKIESGQVTLNREKVDVAAVCQASLRMIKQLAQKKNHQIFFDVDTSIGAVWADERRLKQMLVNLLGNAVKFTPEGGKIGLQVRGDREKNILFFSVWDTGIGIREEDLPRLFQPFTQLDSNLARQAGGTGLGLALVAKMAAMHGGSVSVESEPGKGSRFTINIPWESALTTGPLPEWKTGKLQPPPQPSQDQKHTILLIEDTEEVTMLLRDYLEYNGYKVAVAPNGVEGITQAEMVQPSLILMDVQMPVMDGLEATRRMRQIPSLQHIPIIALTALAMRGDRERCLEAGMNDYISKPVVMQDLLNIIRQHLPQKETPPA
jgi:PAS domain S-box-containing protein